MLSDYERATLHEIQDHLSDDPDFERFFRSRVAARPHSWRRTVYASAMGVAALLAGFMILMGLFAVAALFIVAMVVVGLTHRIDKCDREQDA